LKACITIEASENNPVCCEPTSALLIVAFGIGDPYQSEADKVVYVCINVENIGSRSVRNPKKSIHYSEPGIVHLAENPIWKRVSGLSLAYPLNPRVLEE
jgi:hypothetical protein